MVLGTVMIIVMKVSVHTEPVVSTEFLIVSDVKVLTLLLKTPLRFTALWFPLIWQHFLLHPFAPDSLHNVTFSEYSLPIPCCFFWVCITSLFSP